MSAALTPLALASAWMLSSGDASRSTIALRIAGADGDLVHVDVGRVEERAAFRHRHHGDGARHVLGAQRRALQRIERDVDLRAAAGADLLADEQHRRLVALALADDDGAVDRQIVQFAAHGVDRCLVGRLLVAAAAQPRRRHRSALGDPCHLQRESAVEHGAGLVKGGQGHRIPACRELGKRPNGHSPDKLSDKCIDCIAIDVGHVWGLGSRCHR